MGISNSDHHVSRLESAYTAVHIIARRRSTASIGLRSGFHFDEGDNKFRVVLRVDLFSVQLRCLILAKPTLMVDLRDERAIA